MDWPSLLAYITGRVDQELLLRNEYLVTENRLLRNQIKGRVRLSDGERKTLVVLGRNNPSPYTVNGRPLYVHLHGLAIV